MPLKESFTKKGVFFSEGYRQAILRGVVEKKYELHDIGKSRWKKTGDRKLLKNGEKKGKER